MIQQEIKYFPGGIKDGYEPDYYGNLPPFYFPKEKTAILADLCDCGANIQLDQLYGFRFTYVYNNLKVKHLINHGIFEKAYFLYLHALEYNWRLSSKFKKLYQKTGLKIESKIEYNIGKIATGIQCSVKQKHTKPNTGKYENVGDDVQSGAKIMST